MIGDRLDIIGSRWGLDGAEAVLKLRALIDNGDFDTYWRCTSPASTTASTPPPTKTNTPSPPDLPPEVISCSDAHGASSTRRPAAR